MKIRTKTILNLQIHQITIHEFTIHKVSGIQPDLHEWDSTYTTVPARKALCLLWQYGLWSFQTGYTKLERFLKKNQHTQRKLLNFENWTNGEPQ